MISIYRSDYMKKKLIVLTLLLAFSASAALLGCSGKNPSTPSTPNTPNVQSPVPQPTPSTGTANKTFTLNELKTYNGQNGQAAYVAVNGTVYDVTNARKWRNGRHEEGIVAGVDLTNMMGQSPHGNSVLKEVPVVGTLK
jgi:predicted heme/steroid binding protein